METPVKKLIVAGCSMSDRTGVDKAYGDYLSESLGYEYVHEARGCGSNHRIWRRITQMVMDGTITDNDLLLIQYTKAARHEIWSRHEKDGLDFDLHQRELNPADVIVLRELYKTGNILRYKTDSARWQAFTEERQLFKLIEENFLDNDWELDKFKHLNFSFQHMLSSMKIPTMFLRMGGYCPPEPWYTKLPEHYEYVDWVASTFRDCALSETDNAHMGDHGHKRQAIRIETQLREEGLI